jgi:hypothetical protein
MTAGFYKAQDEQLIYAPNYVESSDYVLIAADKDGYIYPIDGWTWFESEEEANSSFGIIVVNTVTANETI